MKRTVSILWLVLVCAISVHAQYPSIHAHRPRIYADSVRLSWLCTAIRQPGDCRKTFEDMRYAYENWWINDPQLYVVGSDSTKWHWDWSSSWAAPQTFLSVLIATLTDDTLEWKRCRFIAEQVTTRVDTADFAAMEWYDKESLFRMLSDAGGVALDWASGKMPPSLRQRLARSMYTMAREFMNTYIYTTAGNSYVSSHNTWNTIYCNQNALVLHDAEGLSTQQRDTVAQWYRDVYDKLTRNFIPIWAYYRDDDGGWNWGAAYAMWSLVDQFQLFENMRAGTDKNFYADLPWIRNSINQYIYFIQPNGKTIHLGDGETGIHGDRVIYLHARVFRDPRSLRLAQYWSQPSMTPNTMDKYAKLLYKDFSMDSVPPPGNPLNWWADKVGLSVSFSSWERDATMVTFFNSPSKRAAHEHRDNNSFAVFKHAPLLVDAGYYDSYGSAHYRNYYQRTIAHNSIVVHDSSDRYACFGAAASNDGGQVESAALMNFDDIFRPANQRGTWIRYAPGERYSYSVADAQLSYDSSKLDFFRRRVLHIRPDQVLVLDHVHLKNAAVRQREVSWVGHFAERPAISGRRTNVVVPDHIETFDGKDCGVSHGAGNLSIRTLLPDETRTTVIGGQGFEYWVDGINYPPLTQPDTSYYTPGSWRIEVTPVAPADSVVYLHAIETGDSLHASTPGGKALRSEASVGVDWRDTIYFFAADADTGKTYHVFHGVEGDREVGLFAADMAQGWYSILVDGIAATKSATDSNGILQTSVVLPPDSHAVEIVRNTTGIHGPERGNDFRLYPNPARSEIFFDIDAVPGDADIAVYSAMGELKVKTRGKLVDLSALAPGIYFATFRHGGRYRCAIFAKM
jgi:hypothetical protein